MKIFTNLLIVIASLSFISVAIASELSHNDTIEAIVEATINGDGEVELEDPQLTESIGFCWALFVGQCWARERGCTNSCQTFQGMHNNICGLEGDAPKRRPLNVFISPPN